MGLYGKKLISDNFENYWINGNARKYTPQINTQRYIFKKKKFYDNA